MTACERMRNLYDSMAAHPDIKPMLDMLDLVEPCDEFSRALILVRDCFSPSDTLRQISRSQLRAVCSGRIALLNTYQSTMLEASKAIGCEPRTFLEAWESLPSASRESLQAAYAQQVNELMGRAI